MSIVLIIAGCIALNAVLAGLEVAFVSASKADLRTRVAPDDVRLRQFLAMREAPERTLSAIQVGITLVSILSGAAGGAGAQGFLSPFLRERFAFSFGAANAIAIAVVAIPLMLATVVAGELVPKVLALRHAEHIALAGARVLHVLEQIFLPVVALLTSLTRLVVARVPSTPFAAREAEFANQASRRYALDLIDLAQRRVRDAMVPWLETVKADASASPPTLTDLALASGHTRLPIVQDEHVIGVLHTKELLTFLAAGERDWRALVRPAVTVSPDEPLLGVLRLLQRRRSHMAIVMTLERMPLGVVTLEDILEEVLGDLYDEDDDRAVERLLAARGKLKEVRRLL